MKLSVLGFLLFASVNVQAQQSGVYTEWLSTSSNMNWSSGMVTAEGFGVAPQGKREEVGRLLACRAAVTDAQRNLIEATKGVRVSVSTSVSKFAADYDIVKTAVDGVVRGASILERKMGDDATCKVSMGLFVSGTLSNSIYQSSVDNNSVYRFFNRFISGIVPKAYAQTSSTASERFSPWLPDYDRLDERVSKLETNLLLESPEFLLARKELQPSGLIIDVRGQKFLPSMTPNLLQPNGNVIYPSVADKQLIMNSGKLLSLFSRSLEFALNHPVVGDKPLLIKASVAQKNQASIQLSEQNAKRLIDLASNNFFQNPGVIIVLD